MDTKDAYIEQLENTIKNHYITPWNNMGGSVVGQKRVMPNNINIVKSFCSPDDYYINPIVFRSMIRELSQNPEWA